MHNIILVPQVLVLQVAENKKQQMELSFYFVNTNTHIYLDFWLCACAFSTLTTIFCSSIRKARLILEDKEQKMLQTTVRSTATVCRTETVPAPTSPVTHALGAHGASVGSADMLLGFGEPHEHLRSNSSDLQERRTMRRSGPSTALVNVERT